MGTLRVLRTVGLCEGLSFLLLLLVAMPLKYLADRPEPVRAVGAAHGAIFLVYLAVGVAYGLRARWGFKRFVALGLAASLPLGTFVFDGALKREEAGGSG